MTLSDCAIVIYFAHLSIKKSSNNVSPSDKLYWKEQDFSERPSFLCVRGFFCAACTRPVRKVSSRCWWSLRSQPYFVILLSPHTLSTWGQVFSKMYKAPENVPAFYLNLGAVYLIPGAVYLGTAGMRVLVSEEEELGTSFVTFHNLSACRTGVTTWRWKLIHFQIPPL